MMNKVILIFLVSILPFLSLKCEGDDIMKPQPRRHHTSVHLDGKDYLYGGYTGIAQLNDLWEYSPDTNKWIAKANSPLKGRSGHIATAYNGKIYVFGGVTDAQTASKEFMEYNPSTNIWSVINNVPVGLAARNHGSGAIYGDKWYVFAGHSVTPGAAYDLSDLWVYDFTNQTWTQKANNLYRRSAQTAVFYDGKMYSFGGDSNQSADAPISIYSPLTDTWEEKTTPWGYIHKATSVVYGSFIYVYAGNDPANTNALRKYNPVDNTYTTLAAGLETVNAQSAILDGNKMRVFGGNNFDADGCSDKHSSYDFTANAWSELLNYNAPPGTIIIKANGKHVNIPLLYYTEETKNTLKMLTPYGYQYVGILDVASAVSPMIKIETENGIKAVQGYY